MELYSAAAQRTELHTNVESELGISSKNVMRHIDLYENVLLQHFHM